MFVGNAFKETACNDTTSLDEKKDALTKNDPEYPAVIMSTAGEFNDDHGGGASNYTAFGGLVAAKDNLARQELNFK